MDWPFIIDGLAKFLPWTFIASICGTVVMAFIAATPYSDKADWDNVWGGVQAIVATGVFSLIFIGLNSMY